ncbi:LmeA family phospholipid-binding protein [Georgenia sp. M64]|uniref:LmeA family phospholipid-binding protein n=1 Tax=Georgenia sp. M64 TaxID=3120520 RepID=UPI0030E2DCF4
MDRARVKDWLIGATAMLLVLALGLVLAWWAVTEPARDDRDPAPPAPGAGSPATGPPADLREDEVWLSDLTLDAGAVTAAGSTFLDVTAVGRDVVTSDERIVAARLTLEATVPFDVVAAELGEGTTVREADGGQASVVRTVEVLGRELPVVATGTVEVEDGRLVVEPLSIDVGGPSFLSGALAALVRELVTIEHELEGLPEGLVLRDVTVQDDGFRALLRGEDVELTP